jgi:hypothetical protein
VYRLDECFVDVTITDPVGRKFWKDNFLISKQVTPKFVTIKYFQSLVEKVSFNKFVDLLVDGVGLSEKYTLASKKVLGNYW